MHCQWSKCKASNRRSRSPFALPRDIVSASIFCNGEGAFAALHRRMPYAELCQSRRAHPTAAMFRCHCSVATVGLQRGESRIPNTCIIGVKGVFNGHVLIVRVRSVVVTCVRELGNSAFTLGDAVMSSFRMVRNRPPPCRKVRSQVVFNRSDLLSDRNFQNSQR